MEEARPSVWLQRAVGVEGRSELQLFSDLSHSPVAPSATSLGQGSQENRGNACRLIYTQIWGYVYVDLERFVALWLASVNLYYHHVAFQRNG